MFLNDGTGRFVLHSFPGIQIDPEEPYFELGQWGALGDLDGDGDPDWVLGPAINCEPKRRALLVFMNDGEGKFRNETDQRLPSVLKMQHRGEQVDYLELHDVDGDGDLDILVRYYRTLGCFILLNDGKGRFSSSGSCAFGPGYWLDVDGDGLEDSCNGVRWMKNLGNGQFKYMGNYLSLSLVGNYSAIFPVDVDGDGDLDLITNVLVKSRNYNLYDLVVWENLGKRRWKVLFKSTNGATGPLHIADFDNDGDPDILFMNGFMVNDGTGKYTYHNLNTKETNEFVWLFLESSNGYMNRNVGDLDGDGLPELVCNGKGFYRRWFPRKQPHPWWGSYVGVAQNLGDFNFRDATRDYIGNFGVIGNIYGRVFLEDVDGDGDLDLLAQGLYQGLPQVWFNLHQQTAVSGNWGLGKKGHVEVYGHPGDQVLLMAGKPGNPVKIPGFGTWRLGGGVVPVLSATLTKDPNRVNAVHDQEIPIPKNPALLGSKIRFQSLIFRPGYGFKLTNSDTATITNL